MNLRNKKWSDYNISKHRYLELKYFCLQYDEKLKSVDRGLVMRTDPSDRIIRSCVQGSAIEGQAIRNRDLLEDCEKIVDAAMRTDPVLAKWLVESVTKGKQYEQLTGIPCGRTDFYAYRRFFFWQLDISLRHPNHANIPEIEQEKRVCEIFSVNRPSMISS